MGNARDVQAASHDVGGHKQLDFTVAEGLGCHGAPRGTVKVGRNPLGGPNEGWLVKWWFIMVSGWSLVAVCSS